MVGARASRLTLLLLVALSGKATGALLKHNVTASGGQSLALRGHGRNIPLMGGHGITDPKKEKRMMDMISMFRAEICAKMHNEHGVKFESYEECVDFMTEACKPGKDKQMDGDKKEISSGAGFCNSFFPEAEKKAEKQIADEDAAAAATAVAPAPSPAAAPPAAATPAAAPPAIAEAAEEPAEATPAAEAPASEKTESGAGAGAGAAPAPGPAAGPAGAPGQWTPADGPFIPGKSGGKPPGPIAKDEKYYYKTGAAPGAAPGTDMKRVHMDESKKLPTQGYYGPLVEHNDQKTATDDWGKEWSKKSYNAFCAKNPNNPWCEESHWHSVASCLTVSVALVSLVGIANFAA